MNRTSYIIHSIRERLRLLVKESDGQTYNVLDVWDLKKFDEYSAPYVFVRALGETSGQLQYEDNSRVTDVINLPVEIIVGYKVNSDVNEGGILVDEQLERTHEVRQWLENPEFTFKEYRDTQEVTDFFGSDHSGFNGITQTDTVGAAVIGMIVVFQTVKLHG